MPLPSDIPNLQLWLKADAIIGLNDGDNIVTWNDSSGNGRDATGTGISSTRPVYKSASGPNSLPCVRLNGLVGAWFTLPNFLTSYTAGDAFVVIKLNNDPPSTGLTTAHPLGNWGSDTAGSHLPWTDGNIYDTFGTTSRKSAGNPSASLSSWRLYNVYSAASDWQVFVDQLSIFSTTSNTVGWQTGPLIGKSTNVPYYTDGDIAEIFFFSRKLTNGERASMRDYVATEYNLPDLAGQKLTTNTGNCSLNGSGTNLLKGSLLSTAPRAFALNGNTVNMSFAPLKPSASIRVFGR